MTTKTLQQLRRALSVLGVRGSASYTVVRDRIIVLVDGEYSRLPDGQVGVWDMVKATFVN